MQVLIPDEDPDSSKYRQLVLLREFGSAEDPWEQLKQLKEGQLLRSCSLVCILYTGGDAVR